MKTPVAAIVLGTVMGVYAIAAVYLVVTLLPAPFGVLIPIGGLAIPIVLLWPSWFDRGDARPWTRRLLRRLATVVAATPVGACASFLIILAVPGYLTWGENQHRAALERQGKTEVEIVEALNAHRQEPSHFLLDGALLTAVPGLIGGVVTTGAGAILFRKRLSRPKS
jgi:hypothetical protein